MEASKYFNGHSIAHEQAYSGGGRECFLAGISTGEDLLLGNEPLRMRPSISYKKNRLFNRVP